MAESKEYITLVKHKEKLEIALHADRTAIYLLNKEGFIAKDVYEEIMALVATLSESQKAGLVVTEVLKTVEQDPMKYYKFLNCLYQGGSKYSEIYEILKEECLNLEALKEAVSKSKTTPTVLTSSSLPDSGMCV